MGWNIVRRMHPDEPNMHSRLWIKEEIEDILVNESGTKETKYIKLKNTNLHPAIILKGLRNMKKLRFLYVKNIHVPRVCEVSEVNEVSGQLPNALRSLQSNISQLWEVRERKVLHKLTYLDLSGSKLRTFELGMTPCLERLILARCSYLVELQMLNKCSKLKYLNLFGSKVSNLNLEMTLHLEELDLGGCKYLQEIHAPVGCLKKLFYLNLSGCLRFKYFLVDKPNALPSHDSLAKLELIGESLDECPLHPNSILPKFRFKCKYDGPIPSSSGNLEKLLSFGVCACTNLESFSANVFGLQGLGKLKLHGSILEVPNDLGHIQSLEKLHLGIKTIKHLSDSICMLKHLKSLELESCLLLEELPKDLGRLECLKELKLKKCKALREIPNSICKIKGLTYLSLSGCHEVEKLPEELRYLECLKKLKLKKCRSLQDIPNSICMIKTLSRLDLSYCHQVVNLPEELGCIECLEELDLSDCISLLAIPNSICKMKSLTYLNLGFCQKLERLPEELGRLACLKVLSIEGAGISRLPQSIYHLKDLSIYGSRRQIELHGLTSFRYVEP